MSYKNAAEILPSHLLEQVQKYIDGGLVYIPKNGKKTGWGCLSGARKSIDIRNSKILNLHSQGYSISELADKFYLSEETIKKIVYNKK
ncbi:CD3324 family protein [Sporosalibacterium faouarense]|uniref:CD3324 family protein n=1 Tax=Sporosalibacterium faouarense TaxID=516123 RepID=UPI00141C5705|nr:CD3324 family protein [Sporosalibacterium faouarense]MTI47327.1 hypothetical protein [Bacillota bacterium]